jgi:CBS domain containing-hemolysin-like protein
VSTGLALTIALALLALNGFFVAAEFALLAARRSKIEQLVADGNRRARSALAGLRELSLMLAGAQLGITMCSLGLGAIAEPALAHLFEDGLELLGVPSWLQHAIAFTVALAIVVFLHMVVGEMAPKSWAITHPESSAVLLAPPFRAFTRLARPVIAVLNLAANGVVRLFRVQPQDELAMPHSASDLAVLLDESGARGLLPRPDSELLGRALRLRGRTAAAILTPRGEVVAVPATASVAEVEWVGYGAGRSRLPVYDDRLDRVVGVLHVKDALLQSPGLRPTVTARQLARPALFVPASRELEALLEDLKSARQHLAVVTDEAGAVAGVVTLEDLLEEIAGEFDDESDTASGHPGSRAPATGTEPAARPARSPGR